MHKKDRPMLSVTALLYGSTAPTNQMLFQQSAGNGNGNGMTTSISPSELSISPIPGALSPIPGSNSSSTGGALSGASTPVPSASSYCDTPTGGLRTPGTPPSASVYPPNHPLSGSKHLCAICEDRASGKHYGVYSCEGCKGFFKRTVRKDLTYVCRDDKRCIVDKRQRNRCQYCRYQKCLDMGMKREAVQEERQRNSKADNEVESSTPMPGGGGGNGQPFSSNGGGTQMGLNSASFNVNNNANNNSNSSAISISLVNLSQSLFLELTIEKILEAQKRIEVRAGEIPPSSKIATREIELLFRWIRFIPYFGSLPKEDQVTLLKTGWNELLIAEFSYRSIHKADALVLANGVVVSRANAQHAGIGNIMDRVLNELVAKFREMGMDRSELGCLRAIVLLNPAVGKLKNGIQVEHLRDRIYSILEVHCRTRYPEQSSRFAKLLVRLPALRSIGLKCVEHLFMNSILAESNRKDSIDLFIKRMLESSFD